MLEGSKFIKQKADKWKGYKQDPVYPANTCKEEKVADRCSGDVRTKAACLDRNTPQVWVTKPYVHLRETILKD